MWSATSAMFLVIQPPGTVVEAWQIVAAGLHFALAAFASAHTVLYKRDSRAAIAWVGFIWLVPFAGAILYFLFGVNRIRRKAVLLRGGLERYRAHESGPQCPPDELHRHLPGHTGHLNMLARLVGKVVERPLVPGNKIEPLLNGDAALRCASSLTRLALVTPGRAFCTSCIVKK